MSVIIELIVKVLALIFSTTLERHDKKEEANAATNKIEEFRATLGSAAVADDSDQPVDVGLAVALSDQHDRVRQAILDSGFGEEVVHLSAAVEPTVQRQRDAAESTPVLPRTPSTALIAQLKKDEGFRARPYWDISQWTYGYGCEAPSKDAVITEFAASALLLKRTQQSVDEFFKLFKGHEHKFNVVRQECFINMLFNMGLGNAQKGMKSFVNTLAHIFDYDEPDWSRVSYNLTQSKWYRQVGSRAVRICKEVKTGQYA